MAFLRRPHPLLTLGVVVVLLSSFDTLPCSSQTNRLLPGQSIALNQTLVSANGRFALGFFSPTFPPSKYYLGLWFNQIPNRTVVWICNREAPLSDHSSGALAITSDGNLVVLDLKEHAIRWSTNLSALPSNTSAALLDSGNLVLQGGSDAGSVVLWQSFDHPTDTVLAGMKLYMNLSTRKGNRIVAWRAHQDPSVSEFSIGFDPATALQLLIWRGSKIWIRGVVVTGNTFVAEREEGSETFVGVLMDSDNHSISYSFQTGEGSKTLWVMLDPMGIVRNYLWQPASNTWWLLSSDPVPCTYYNPCGPNALCSLNSTDLKCNCLRGYLPTSPEEWEAGSYGGGCRRKVELGCGGDGFVGLTGLLLPDGFRLLRDLNNEECGKQCLGSCNCTAYAYSGESVLGSSTRCLVWEGDLVDAKTMRNGSGEALYLRLAASDLDTNGPSSKRKTVAIAIIVSVLALGIILLLGSCLYIRKKRTGRNGSGNMEFVAFKELEVPGEVGDNKSAGFQAMNFQKLVVATNNFCKENKIGEGGFGPVYKGRLEGGQEIAIKTLSKSSTQGFTQFRNEVELIARLQHRNLVKLLGWCIHDKETMLIYEFMPNKSLDRYIFGPLSLKAELNWTKRFHIIHGIAQGLLYLHRYSRFCVIHRDLKSSNILLDREMNPKISDFGIAKVVSDVQSEENTEKVTGTLGYMSPEYAFDGQFSEKSDVFSFGVILLEIITGKKVTGYYPYKKSFNLLGYVWEHWKESRILEVVDDSFGTDYPEHEVIKCFQIALLCVQEGALDRPSTPSIVSMLSMEKASLPAPMQPAFSVERYSHDVPSSRHTFASTSVDVTHSSRFGMDNTLDTVRCQRTSI